MSVHPDDASAIVACGLIGDERRLMTEHLAGLRASAAKASALARTAREAAAIIEGDSGKTFGYVAWAPGGDRNAERLQVLVRHAALLADEIEGGA